MLSDERPLILEEEYLIVRHSGEIPEVALHSSLHYLCQDPEGPQMLLSGEELDALHGAVLERYLEMILRDLTPANRSLSLFRGVERAIINWDRFQLFSRRLEGDARAHIPTVAKAFVGLVEQEWAERRIDQTTPGMNCNPEAVLHFIEELGLGEQALPPDWRRLCRDR
ncbi:hypothetical protein [Desulfogranum mediterraneum]|uniref:hypothetical protein n=1 Tax=Desulfogranum mediterraneum TaxID=160661 RepID=UPI0003FBA821|nr:hypothetical protein [Desulfogranum mediterraneum]